MPPGLGRRLVLYDTEKKCFLLWKEAGIPLLEELVLVAARSPLLFREPHPGGRVALLCGATLPSGLGFSLSFLRRDSIRFRKLRDRRFFSFSLEPSPWPEGCSGAEPSLWLQLEVLVVAQRGDRGTDGTAAVPSGPPVPPTLPTLPVLCRDVASGLVLMSVRMLSWLDTGHMVQLRASEPWDRTSADPTRDHLLLSLWKVHRLLMAHCTSSSESSFCGWLRTGDDLSVQHIPPPQRGTATSMAPGGEESNVLTPLNQLGISLAVEASRSHSVPRAHQDTASPSST